MLDFDTSSSSLNYVSSQNMCLTHVNQVVVKGVHLKKGGLNNVSEFF